MGTLVTCDDACPFCKRHHRMPPVDCVNAAHEVQLEADILGEECNIVEMMRNYAGFWTISDDGVREGDVE